MNMHASVDKPDPPRCAGCSALSDGICRTMFDRGMNTWAVLSSSAGLAAGDVVTIAGRTSGIAGNVTGGILKVCTIRRDGCEFVTQFLFPGDFFYIPSQRRGEAFVARAVTAAGVCLAEERDLTVLFAMAPKASHAALISVMDDLDEIEKWIMRMGSAPVNARVAHFLLLLASRMVRQRTVVDESGALVVDVPIPRRDIAAFLETTRESISRQLHGLSDRGVIRILNSKRFVITDREQLAEIAGV